MSQQQFESSIRELLTLAASVLLAYGVGTAGLWEEVVGGLSAIALLVWGFRANVGWEKLGTLARKIITSIGGVLLALNLLEADKVNVLLPLALTAFSMVWGLLAKGPVKPTGKLPMILLLLALLSSLPSCIVGVDESGNYTLRPDPYTLDKGFDYLIRHEDSAKGEVIEYYDDKTGDLIAPSDYPLYEIEPLT